MPFLCDAAKRSIWSCNKISLLFKGKMLCLCKEGFTQRNKGSKETTIKCQPKSLYTLYFFVVWVRNALPFPV